ncbi:MAG: PAS domain S-box protein [Gammaproteobacteria bacterium]
MVNQLVDQLPDLLLLVDRRGKVASGNRAAHHFWSFKKKPLEGRSVWRLFKSAEFSVDQLQQLTGAMGAGDQLRLQLTARGKSGRKARSMDVRLRPLIKGKEVFLLLVARPLPLGLAATADQQNSRSLADKPADPVVTQTATAPELSLQEAFKNLRDHYLRIDERGAILSASPNLAGELGLSSANPLTGRSLRKFVSDQTWQQLETLLSAEENHFEDIALPLQTVGGGSLRFQFNGAVWHHPGGWKGGIEGTLRHTGGQRDPSAALSDTHVRYQSLIRQSNDVVLLLRGTEIIDLNDQAEELFGTRREQLIGKSFETLSPALQPHHRQSSELIKQHFAATHDGNPQRFDWRGRRIDGTPIDLEVSLNLIELGGDPHLQAVLRDLTEQRAQQAALQRSEQMYDTIINNSGDGITIIDLDRRVVFANRQFQQLTGFDNKELLGSDFLEFLDEQTRELATKLFSHCFASGKDLHTQAWVTTGSGSRARIEINGVLTEYDRMPAMIAFVRDITVAYKTAEELRRHRDNLADLVAQKTLNLSAARDEAESANRAKSRFLANMSHELRTPLHSVLSFAEMGATGSAELEPDQLQLYFRRIQESGKRLLTLLNDLIDLSQLEAGGGQYQKSGCNLSRLAGKTLDDMQIEIGDREVTVRNLPDGQDIEAWCDPDRIAQVLNNLVSNALKFSDDDTAVVITLSTDDQRQTMVMVEDRGAGLPDKDKDRLFDPFVESTRTRNEAGGTGLGLAICKHVINAHGGTIGGFNRAGGGSSFYFTLPAEEDNGQTPAPAQNHSP